ncbi:MAG TPA: GNAT family N-acetyltransferase, partial [Mycobacteriales bacterium]|nr:GNAT family N-acetyltransferase [Mycobacteriales bacterium]
GDLATVHRVITEAFRGHFRSVALPFEEWEQRHLARADDGAPMLLAELDGEVVGALVSSMTTPGVGWVRSLGVLPVARGRGVGRALLTHAFADFRRLGAERVSLGVDTENATGAVALYERVGMTVERRIDVYAKDLTE